MTIRLGHSIVLAAFIVLSSGIINTAYAERVGPVPMLQSPFGSGPLEGDTIFMNQLIQRRMPITIMPQETPGYLYNIREMATNPARWKSTVFLTEDTALQMAVHGGKPEIKDFFAEKYEVGDFKLLYGDAWWGIGKFFVTFDPNIKTPHDFKGKRVGLGLRSQSDWGFYPRVMLELLTEIDGSNTSIRHLTPVSMVQQLIDRSVDVVIAALGAEPNFKEWLIPGPMRQLEAAGRPLHYIGFTEEEIERYNQHYGTTFLYHEIPAGTMPLQTKPVGVAFNRGYKAAHATLPDEVAYQLVMAVAKLGPDMKDLHPSWSIWSPELMLHGLAEENVHPGAKRAYVELGWWDRHKEWPAAVIPTN